MGEAALGLRELAREVPYRCAAFRQRGQFRTLHGSPVAEGSRLEPALQELMGIDRVVLPEAHFKIGGGAEETPGRQAGAAFGDQGPEA